MGSIGRPWGKEVVRDRWITQYFERAFKVQICLHFIERQNSAVCRLEQFCSTLLKKCKLVHHTCKCAYYSLYFTDGGLLYQLCCILFFNFIKLSYRRLYNNSRVAFDTGLPDIPCNFQYKLQQEQRYCITLNNTVFFHLRDTS